MVMGTVPIYLEMYTMTLVIPLGFAEVSVEMRNDADPEPWYITFGIDITEAGGDTDLMHETVSAALIAGIQPSLSTSTTITGAKYRIGQASGPPLAVDYSLSLDGASSAQRLPQNCALLVRKQTLRAGRPGKGRFFVPSVPEGSVSEIGVLETDYKNTMQAQMGDMWTILTYGPEDPPVGPPCPMVLLHNSGTPGGVDPDLVTSLQVQSVIATQRRRLRR